MIRGQVIGEVWATKRATRLEGLKLLLVAEQVAKVGTGRVVVATDNLDAGIGDEVLVAFGSGARNAISPGSRDVLVDAAVVQIIDGSNS
ncbi:MAG TPA: EutN/CcmL family microcompartment protein [Myxococcota bacterium]|nr:EutN/CcmL family microcompartment protein [Myxococcota bacterium]HON26391.1 EutN/CcmL family microcompartment protein [Myxococcota bacterium]HOS63058.1 EutN/CcmL family microcompartment protein [Myxococcota bacterium]HPC92985.1 EutN/CcmL family microcompartment protein [Myxococcota bacterium]HPL24421.1 EutN/CcmL family microcompartment protein [Myxococcota bacterium]